MHKITLSKTQYQNLLVSTLIGNFVISGILEDEEKNWEHLNELEEYLLSFAKDFSLKNLTKKEKGVLYPSKELDQIVEAIINNHNDEVFWQELIMRLGNRDFLNTMSKAEKKTIESEHQLPDRIYELYEKYQEEFTNHEIDRLKIIDENAS